MVKRRFLATSSPCMSFLLTLLQTTLRRNPWRMLERNLKICLDKCTMRSLKRRISGTVMQQCNLNVTNIQTISTKSLLDEKDLEMFYLNTIEQLFLFVEQLDQLEVCLHPKNLQLSNQWIWDRQHATRKQIDGLNGTITTNYKVKCDCQKRFNL